MHKILQESRVPEVSTFWYINGEFYGDSVPYRDGEIYGDFIQNDNDHITLWDSLKIILNTDVDYDYYPRGRVMMNTKIKKSIVVCDKCLHTESIKKKLCTNYNLRYETTIFDTDEHYTCKDCV